MAIIGNPILLSGGSSIASTGWFNFPLTISDSQPTPEREGHIWVKDAALNGKITNVRIEEAVPANAENGSLIFTVGNLIYRNYSVSEKKKLTDGTEKQFSISDSMSTEYWLVSSHTGDTEVTIRLQRPIIYSKVDNKLQIETAYIWDGTQWVSLSTKGNYMMISSYNISNTSLYTLLIYNLNDNLTEDHYNMGVTLPTDSAAYGSFSKPVLSVDGTYLTFDNNSSVWKRDGDVYKEYFRLKSSDSLNLGGNSCTPYYKYKKLSPDGQTLVVMYYKTWADTNNNYVVIYKNDGTTFKYHKHFQIANSTSSTVTYSMNIDATNIVCSYGTYGQYIYIFTLGENGYVMKKTYPPSSSTETLFTVKQIWVHNDDVFWMGYVSSSSEQGIFKLTITKDSNNQSFSKIKSLTNRANTSSYYSSVMPNNFYSAQVSLNSGNFWFIPEDGYLSKYNVETNAVTVYEHSVFDGSSPITIADNESKFIMLQSSTNPYAYTYSLEGGVITKLSGRSLKNDFSFGTESDTRYWTLGDVCPK